LTALSAAEPAFCAVELAASPALFAAFSVLDAAFCAAEPTASPPLFAAFSVPCAAFCAVSPVAAAAPPAAPAAAAPAVAPGDAELLDGLLLISEELVLGLVEGLVEVDDVWSVGGVVLLEGGVLDGLVEQLEETKLALSTLMVSPLAVPVTETVWPT
jgi:hypothetical protein